MSVRSILAKGELVAGALETIQKLTGVGGPKAEAALVAIRAVLATLDEGIIDKVSPQAALAQIEAMHKAIEHNDEIVIAELMKRFGAQ